MVEWLHLRVQGVWAANVVGALNGFSANGGVRRGTGVQYIVCPSREEGFLTEHVVLLLYIKELAEDLNLAVIRRVVGGEVPCGRAVG